MKRAVVAIAICACGGRSTDGVDSSRSDAGGDAAADAAVALDAATADDGVYSARALIGGLDRIVLVKASRARNLCFRVVLASPSSADRFGVSAPAGWGVEDALVATPSTACDPPSTASQIVTAAGGSGQITFSAGAPYPCSIGVSATLFFPPGTFHPQSETLQNAAVPIDGACGTVDAGSD